MAQADASPWAPLSGADYFFLALAEGASAAGIETPPCRTRIELAGDLDEGVLRAAASRVGLLPWTGATRLAGHASLARPRWLPGPAAEWLVEARACRCGEVTGVLEPEPARRHGLCLEVCRHRGRTSLSVVWDHGRMDGRGAELLLASLDRAAPAGAPVDPSVLLGASPAGKGLLAGLRAMRGLRDLMTTVSRPPLASLTRPVTPGAQTRYRLIELDRAESDRAVATCAAVGGGFFKGTVYLAATMLAFEAVRRRRGAAPGACVVHVPHDLRKAGARGPVLTNALSFFLHRAEPEALGTLPGLVKTLREQMTSQLRDGTTAVFADALRAFLHLPLGMYARALARPAGGQVSSFTFSDTGDAADLGHLFGLPVERVVRLAPVPYPPGLQVLAGRSAGRLTFTVSWLDGCLADDEVAAFEAELRAVLVSPGGATS